jgi:hypothetical protein
MRIGRRPWKFFIRILVLPTIKKVVQKTKTFNVTTIPINSLGFIDRDLPRWQKNPDEYVVGIVGGSGAGLG